jgi:hypothetical protein
MKTIYAICLLIFLTACSKAEKSITLNLETCQILGKNKLSLSSLQSEHIFNLGNKFNKENQKKYSSLKRDLKPSEYSIHSGLDNELNKLERIIAQEVGSKPTKRNGDFWGYIKREWKDGISLRSNGSRDGMYLALDFEPDKINVIPNIDSKSSFDYIESLFSDKIHKKDVYSGGFSGSLEINCGGVKVGLHMHDEEGLRLSNLAYDKGEKDNKNIKRSPTLSGISVDLYHRINKKSQESSSKNSLFSAGDRVNVIFENGKQCKATILIAGNDQSKVEYNEFCDVSFAFNKSKNEKEWVPAIALSAR